MTARKSFSGGLHGDKLLEVVFVYTLLTWAYKEYNIMYSNKLVVTCKVTHTVNNPQTDNLQSVKHAVWS